MIRCMRVLRARVLALWESKTNKHPQSLTGTSRVLWFLLCLLEPLYRIGFYLVGCVRSIKKPYAPQGLHVVCVGNISVGGTGKTVFIRFLARLFGPKQCTVLTRGYGAAIPTHKPVMVHNGWHLVSDVAHAGDEAYMLASLESISTVVSSNRVQGCQFVQQHLPDTKFLLLDDGYQNNALSKNCQFLLLDARAPFGNGHCLPAGPLREKDMSRADALICTHADALTATDRTMLLHQLNALHKCPIFWGRHAPAGIWQANNTRVPTTDLAAYRFIAVAGVGSFSGFARTARLQGASVLTHIPMDDHQAYTAADATHFAMLLEHNQATGLLVTEKDWVKLAPLCAPASGLSHTHVYVLRVQFEFLSPDEYSTFAQFVGQQLHINLP